MLSTFLAGCVVGAFVATMLSETADVPLSFGDLYTYYLSTGWSRPTRRLIHLFAYPVTLSLLLLLLLGTRRLFRAHLTRPLWVHAPAVPKALLELHSAYLGVVVLTSLLCSAGLMLQQGETVSVASACVAASTPLPPEQRQSHQSEWGIHSPWLRSGQRTVDPVCQQPRRSAGELAGATLAAVSALWPEPVAVGLLVQMLLPMLIHPNICPRLPAAIARCARRGRHAGGARAAVAGGLLAAAASGSRAVGLVSRGVRERRPPMWRRVWSRLPLVPTASLAYPRVVARAAFRCCYAAVLLLSVLWVIPLTIEAVGRWWREEILQAHERGAQAGGGASLSPAGGAGDCIAAAGCGGAELAKATRAAATLRTLAFFSSLRRVGKAFDLQVGHYYGTASRHSSQRRGYHEKELMGARRIVPTWARAYWRSARWLAVTPPTYLFWHALSAEMGSSRGWRRLLLPTALFAAQEAGQTLRLILLLIVNEGYSMHEHLRKRSARWLHRLELCAAVHWLSLAVAVAAAAALGNAERASCSAAADASSASSAPPPSVGVLVVLPTACLTALTFLEQLPGDASEILTLLADSTRASVPGDLRHLVSGNSWYRGVLSSLVVDPEAMVEAVDLATAQRNLPWWLRPPLPSSHLLRRAAAYLDNGHEPSDPSPTLASEPCSPHSPSRSLSESSDTGPFNAFRAERRTSNRRPLGGGMPKVQSELALALARPARSFGQRILGALPDDLAAVLAGCADVVLAATFDHGSKRTTERQIAEVLRVVGTFASHAVSAVAFNWRGRRRLLGGLASLEDMLALQHASTRAERSMSHGHFQDGAPLYDGPFESILASAAEAEAEAEARSRRAFSAGASAPDGTRPAESSPLPPLLALLAARERKYIAELRAATAPVGRHGTGTGRSTARDPLSFGFHGSLVLDEDAERELVAAQRGRAGARAAARRGLRSPPSPPEADGARARPSPPAAGRAGSWRAVAGTSHFDLPSSASPAVTSGAEDVVGAEPPSGGWLPWLPWLRWPFAPKPAAQANLYVEHGVRVDELFEAVRPDHSFACRTHELVARRAHAGVSGTPVRVRRTAEQRWYASVARPASRPPEGAKAHGATPPRDGRRSSLTAGDAGGSGHGGRHGSSCGRRSDEQDASGRASFAGDDGTASPASAPRTERRPLWFHAVVTAVHHESATADIEYTGVALEGRFGDGCDDTTLNILLPDLCVSIEGLSIDLIERLHERPSGETSSAPHDGHTAREALSLIGARCS